MSLMTVGFAAKLHYLLPFRDLHFTYLENLKEFAICGLIKANTLCRIESSELKGKLRASLWIKVPDLVSKLEESPDSRSIIKGHFSS